MIVYPDSSTRVVDLDELAQAFHDKLITAEVRANELKRKAARS